MSIILFFVNLDIYPIKYLCLTILLQALLHFTIEKVLIIENNNYIQIIIYFFYRYFSVSFVIEFYNHV